jgi:hypothetical protein
MTQKIQDPSSAAAKARLQAIMDRFGCLPSLSRECTEDLPGFDRLALARSLERMIARSRDYGMTKITVHMDLLDAAQLAEALRK